MFAGILVNLQTLISHLISDFPYSCNFLSYCLEKISPFQWAVPREQMWLEMWNLHQNVTQDMTFSHFTNEFEQCSISFVQEIFNNAIRLKKRKCKPVHWS